MDAGFPFSELGIELEDTFGDAGYFIFHGLNSLIWMSDTSELNLSKISTHSKRIRRDPLRVQEVLDFLIREKIFISDGEYFTNPDLKADKEKMLAKQETYRRNAMAKQTKSNSSAIAQANGEHLQSKSNEPELEPELELKKETVSPEFSDLTKETLLITLKSAGLEGPDLLDRAVRIAKTQYPKPTVLQLHKPWIMQELLKQQAEINNLKNSELRLNRAKNPQNNGYKSNSSQSPPSRRRVIADSSPMEKQPPITDDQRKEARELIKKQFPGAYSE